MDPPNIWRHKLGTCREVVEHFCPPYDFTKVCNPVVDTILYQSVQSCGWYDTLPKCAILWLIRSFTKVCNPVVDMILYQSVQSCGWYDTLPKCAILWLTRYFLYQSVQSCDWYDTFQVQSGDWQGTLPKCAFLRLNIKDAFLWLKILYQIVHDWRCCTKKLCIYIAMSYASVWDAAKYFTSR